MGASCTQVITVHLMKSQGDKYESTFGLGGSNRSADTDFGEFWFCCFSPGRDTSSFGRRVQCSRRPRCSWRRRKSRRQRSASWGRRRRSRRASPTGRARSRRRPAASSRGPASASTCTCRVKEKLPQFTPLLLCYHFLVHSHPQVPK